MSGIVKVSAEALWRGMKPASSLSSHSLGQSVSRRGGRESQRGWCRGEIDRPDGVMFPEIAEHLFTNSAALTKNSCLHLKTQKREKQRIRNNGGTPTARPSHGFSG